MNANGKVPAQPWWRRLWGVFCRPACPVCKRRAKLYSLMGRTPMCAFCLTATLWESDRQMSRLQVRYASERCVERACRSRKL